MDLDYTPEEAAYRAKARAFLEANAELRRPGRVEGYRRGQDRPGALDEAKIYQRKKAEAGFAGITWPVEWHGQGGAPIQEAIFILEEEEFEVQRGFFEVGLRMCVPTLCSFGTAAQRDRHALAALRGEEVWCQLFSEPGAGSDLGALRTRAERDGDHWVINGQKLWTSGAQFSDFGLLLVRTDPTLPKHNGLTMFFLAMDTPGIDIRPIRQLSGAANFNEVFFNDVRIPDSQRLGTVGDGWKVAIATLMRERFSPVSRKPDFGEMFAFVRDVELETGPALADPAVQERMADWYVRSEAIRLTRLRIMTSLSRGQTPGPIGSIIKLAEPIKIQDMSNFALDLLGPGGVMTGSSDEVRKLFEESFIYSAALRIAGGTDEIQHNIVAERVLGLPPDVRADKGIPFLDIPTGPNAPAPAPAPAAKRRG